VLTEAPINRVDDSITLTVTAKYDPMPTLSLLNVNYGAYSHMASLPGGGYVFVGGSGGSSVGVNASGIYDASGVVLASNFNPNGVSTGLAVLADGRILVAGFNSTIHPNTSAFVRIFSPQGVEASTFSPSAFATVSAAGTNDGGFILGINTTTTTGVYASDFVIQKYDANSSKLLETTLIPQSLNRPYDFKIAVDAMTGNIATIWSENPNPGLMGGDPSRANKLWLRVWDSGGIPVGQEQSISVPTPNSSNGEFSDLIWTSSGALAVTVNDPQGQAQYAKFFDSAGNATTSLIRVSQDTPLSGEVSGSITPPSITELSGGNLVFAWQSIRNDGSTDIRLRLTDGQGTLLGTEQVIGPLEGDQLNAMLAAQPGNKFALSWVDASGSTPLLQSFVADASNPSALSITTGNNAGYFFGSPTLISSESPICFARGTQIKTAQGPAIVESLNPHETVIDHEGKATNVKWIGYQRRTPEFAQFDDYLPVKICAGALEENVPVRDLYLSPDHAILVDGHLIHAKALVNGKSIVQMTEWQGDIEYYHIETENHEIIFAEGVPCETFIDNVSRQQFDNYAEYQALYPFSTVMKELPLPRVRHRRQLPSAIATRIDQRAQVLARQASS
jgi:hypothetical protein